MSLADVYDALVSQRVYKSAYSVQQATWFELTMRTLWSEGLEPQLSGCIGKLVDIHMQKEEEDRLKALAKKA